MAKPAVAKEITIPALNIKHMTIRVVGDSPLVMHKWSEKAKRMIKDKQAKRSPKAREVRDPEQEYINSMHYIGNPKDKVYGFPSVGFKLATVAACRNVEGIPMTLARGAFHVMGEYVEIHGEPTMREDMVRVTSGSADIRYRGEFKDWWADVPIRFNADVLSPEQIITLFNIAGFACGIGEMRPGVNGFPYGMFHVEGGPIGGKTTFHKKIHKKAGLKEIPSLEFEDEGNNEEEE